MKTLIVAVMALALFLPASVAQGKVPYRSCDVFTEDTFPAVQKLTIKMRDARVDGRTNRCVVANIVSVKVAEKTAKSGLPSKVTDVRGDGWYVGTFRCRYAEKDNGEDGIYMQATCVHKGKAASTVRFRLVT